MREEDSGCGKMEEKRGWGKQERRIRVGERRKRKLKSRSKKTIMKRGLARRKGKGERRVIGKERNGEERRRGD